MRERVVYWSVLVCQHIQVPLSACHSLLTDNDAAGCRAQASRLVSGTFSQTSRFTACRCRWPGDSWASSTLYVWPLFLVRPAAASSPLLLLPPVLLPKLPREPCLTCGSAHTRRTTRLCWATPRRRSGRPWSPQSNVDPGTPPPAPPLCDMRGYARLWLQLWFTLRRV